MLYRNAIGLVTGLVVAMTAATAAEPPPPSNGGLEEVVVTAQKREQNFQKLAISAEVVTSQEIARKGVSSVQDAIRQVPGVKVQNIAGSGAGRIFIRGIGTASGDDYSQVTTNGVSLTLDGVNSNSAANLLNSMFDVDRVEVLKGPQGTLYGAGALGGVVNVISAKPKHEFEAEGKLMVGNYALHSLQGMVNLPLGDKFAVRLTATSSKRDGYVTGQPIYTFAGPMLPFLPFPTWLQSISDNYGAPLTIDTSQPGPPIGMVTVPSGDFGSSDSENYRARALWNPTSKLSIMLGYEHTRDTGTSPTWLNPQDVLNGHLVCCNLVAAPPPPATPGWYATSYYKRSSETTTAEVSYDFGKAGSLTFIPSHNVIADVGRSFELSPTALRTNPALTQTQDTYELRLNSPASSKIIWVAGVYDTRSDRQLGAESGSRTPSPDTDGDLATTEYGIFEVGRPFNTRNVYGQITFPFREGLRGTIGGRYAENDSDYSYQLYLTANPCSSPPAAACPASDTVTETTATLRSKSSHPATTWSLGLEYDVTPTSMLYGRVATGFKAGGVQLRNTGIPITTTAPLDLGTYKSETSTAYEIGSKNRFRDNTLQLNGALFYTRWNDMQLSQIVCVVAGCSPFVDATYTAFYNAGPSTQYGLEMDAVWAVTQRDRLSMTLSSMHGAYGQTAYYWGAPGFQGLVNLDGHEMAQTPKLASNLSYTRAFDTRIGKFSATLDGEYTSSYETTHEYYFAGHTQPGYFRNNVSLTFERKHLQVNMFGRNLQNKTVIQSVFPFGVQGGEPRLFGASVQVSY